LPNRRNIVISRTKTFDEVETYNDPELALDILDKELDDEDEVFVIGGATLYEYFMQRAEWLYLTEIKKTYE
jgi:dihydrofolate reductase